MSIAGTVYNKVPLENRRAAEGRDPRIEFQSNPRLFPRTFLLVESRRAFSETSSPRVVTMWRTFFTGGRRRLVTLVSETAKFQRDVLLLTISSAQR